MKTGELIFKEEVYAIVGAAMEVLNEVGHGLREKTYENALVREFGLRGIGFGQQVKFPVIYKGEVVDEFVPDLVVLGKVIVDAKVIEKITDLERGQVINYLRVTGLPVGVILNFKRAKLEWERVVFSGKENFNEQN